MGIGGNSGIILQDRMLQKKHFRRAFII